MATKKAKKAAMPAKEEEMCGCCSPLPGVHNIEDWMLIMLGGIGLLQAINWINWPGFNSYFMVVWPVLVLVIGAKSLIDRNSCCCE